MSLSSHQRNGGHDEWLTPPEIIAALGPFDLDPCAPVNPPWRTARLTVDIRGDGLLVAWAKEDRIWLNPPFGRESARWMRKMAAHGNGVALLAARTETAMFFESVWTHADAILFLKGRPHFHYVTGERAAANSGAPICLIAYGSSNADCLASCGLAGAFVRLRAADLEAA